MKKPRIITNRGIFYSQERLILHQYRQFSVKRKWDINRLFYAVLFKLKWPKLSRNFFYLHSGLGVSADAFHFFNTVSSTKRPWITTLEADFNRFQSKNFNPIDYALQDSCRYILPYSKWAMENQLRQISNKDIRQIIRRKMEVVYPPQKILVTGPQINIQKVVKFVLVGGEFFRKGGVEILKVFNILDQEGYKFELTIVSALGKGDYPTIASDEDFNYALQEIETKHYIKYHKSLPNSEVLSIIKEANVGLLLSHLETFGYFVLECQACAVPVVTTTQRAFLEINSLERGWFVEVPTNENKSIEYNTPEKRQITRAIIQDNFYKVAKEILDQPNIILSKSEKALAYIEKTHDLQTYKDRIAAIYEEITN